MADKHLYKQGFETGAGSGEKRESRKGGGVLEFLIILLAAFAFVFGFIRPFVLEAFQVPSESMVPTFEIGDRFIANKFVYRFWEPAVGDVVVFSSVEGGDEDLVKRIVALPGDEVTVQNGVLSVNGEVRNEPFVNKRMPDMGDYGPATVPEGEVFVMGDNRANSRDSRFFGPVPIENIEGEAFASFWPLSRIKLL
ncbi:MAG: Signal peptidase I [uncultured Rubrobacteraceae bacterium]|uniref:Signal peptidase I n=1 Tax=uncultured Rubrobacteraceae bacterium TaxID=349277 RepID=A0A6J4QC88_9ACTN|nr:MAG: Signal peptidase I [uncultured Rubrobacteraceae bacterium]